MKRKAKQARSKQTVEYILDGAHQVLLHVGYGSFTTERIAERAGVSVGSIYQYFQNKDDILQQLLNKEATKTLTAFREIAEQNWDNPHDQFKAFLQIGVDESCMGPHMFYEMQRVPVLRQTLADMSQELIQITHNMINKLQPNINNSGAQRLAELTVSTSMGIAGALHTRYDQVLVDDYIEMIANFVCQEQ